jgi:hypothetical protein
MINSLKLGFVVCWIVAFLIDYVRVPSGLVTSLSFLALIAYYSLTFSISISTSRRLLFALFSMLLIFMTVIYFAPKFEPFQLAWYLVMYLLLFVANGHAVIFHPTMSYLPVSRYVYLDCLCVFFLLASLYSSWDMFGRAGAGIINPNVASALCGYLLMVYALEHKLCKLLQLVRRGQISRVMIELVVLIGFLQFSRAFAVWILAAYFLYKTFNIRVNFIAKRLSFVIAIIILVSPLGVFLIPQNSDVSAANDAVRNMPNVFRLKGDGMESDVVRLVHYPVLLSSYFTSSIEKFVGLGIGLRPYRELLDQGEDLHSAYLVIASDGGLLVLSVILFLVIFRGRDEVNMSIVRLLVFSTAAMYGGLLVGLAPFTLCITMLLVAVRILSNEVTLQQLLLLNESVRFDTELEN